jgi:hypothetical protein
VRGRIPNFEVSSKIGGESPVLDTWKRPRTGRLRFGEWKVQNTGSNSSSGDAAGGGSYEQWLEKARGEDENDVEVENGTDSAG